MGAVVAEARLMMVFLWFGFAAGLLYHFLRLICKGKGISIWIRDVLVGAICGALWFRLLLSKNNGNLRPLYVVITALGCQIYVWIFASSTRSCFWLVPRKRINRKGGKLTKKNKE